MCHRQEDVNNMLGQLRAYLVSKHRLQPSQSSLRTTKRVMKANLGPALASTMAEEWKHFKEMLGALEAKEAITAFFEERKPDFSKFA
jgi:enoyl-CoA hydratase/carnithine racemase